MKRYLFYFIGFVLLSCEKDRDYDTVTGHEATGLPVAIISTESSVDDKENYINGGIEIIGGDNFRDAGQTPIEIRGRGNSTWWLGEVWGKKPYQIKFQNKTSLLNMPADRRWVFLSELSDKTFIRNKIARDLGALSVLDYTPKLEFVELVLNEEYQGVYLMGQKVEVAENRVNLPEEGYLIEIDQAYRTDDDDVYFRSNVFPAINEENVFNIKFPDTEEGADSYELIENYIHRFEAVLFSANFDSPTEGYAAYIDVDQMVDWYVIQEIAKSVDARWYSSIFFTYVPGGKIKMGPLWDFDLSFGNVDYADSEFTDGFWIRQNPWINRLFQDPVFRTKVRNRFDYFNSQLPTILEKIDGYALQLEVAQEHNYDEWETLGEYVWPNPVWYDTYQEEVNHLKGWITDRMQWLNDNL